MALARVPFHHHALLRQARAAVITSTFQLGAGLGPARESALWRAGIVRWGDYATAALRLPVAVDTALREAVATASALHAAGDVSGLAALLPAREHWRLFEAFGAGAAYIDIETGDDVVGFAGISAIGMLDRRGPRLLLAGRDLEAFPELARDWAMLVSFNGLAFDVPILREAFPEWQPPLAHVDLRHVLPRLGHHGKLKELEQRLPLHLTRPEHLRSVRGWDAAGLFRRGRDGDREMLRRFAEYNLYDVIGLRTLMAYAHNGMLEALSRRAPALKTVARPLEVPGRGDVLYDVSKILLAL
jgi:uncharacterized protein YprB with RNaseH-like and TPR domain